MQSSAPIDPAVYEWRPCSIMFPRVALKVTRFGTSTSLILPGRYMVRRSRSLGRWVYRSFSD
ncbi:hypothetical protein [Sphingopyxis sp.]|uniref:hypothetical protein n=1 Tax=Sphingopyxis sp. TaxID=1908224 RepID=UPI002EDB2820